MVKTIQNLLSGIILGFGTSILIHFILFEHITFLILLPILPIIGATLGAILVYKKKIPLLKLWQVLFIFTILLSFALSVYTLKSHVLESKRWEIAMEIVLSQTENTALEYEYQTGNGMEVPPNVVYKISSNIPVDQIAKSYDQMFKQNGWETQRLNSKWQKGNIVVYLRDTYRDDNLKLEKENYQIMVDFYGLWYSHLRNPLKNTQ